MLHRGVAVSSGPGDPFLPAGGTPRIAASDADEHYVPQPLSNPIGTGLNRCMGNRPTVLPAGSPTLASLFVSFVSIGMMSFGGGLTAWTRREVVQRKGWLDDQQFLSGYALSQLVPGATNVNLAVFIGTQMRGVPGAIACFCGLTALPLAIVLLAGALYFANKANTGAAWISGALGGIGAVAIGLNLGTGVRLARRNISGLVPAAVTAAVTLSIGVLGFSVLHVLLVMMPVSLP
jgi:chromate transporter